MAATMTISIEEETVRQVDALAELVRGRTKQNANRSSITRDAIKLWYDREFAAANDEPAVAAAGQDGAE